MRTRRSLVTVIVRQPPRPVSLYFADFASKLAWYAPFRVLPCFLSRKLSLNRDRTTDTFYGRMEALARQRRSQIGVTKFHEVHGGKIWVESRSGQGPIFAFTCLSSLSSKSTQNRSSRHVRFWHTADITIALTNVRLPLDRQASDILSAQRIRVSVEVP